MSYKIHVNKQSKGKPENPYSYNSDVEYMRSLDYRSNYDAFNDNHPELLCLTPTGELAERGDYETDGEILWQYNRHGWVNNWNTIKNKYYPKDRPLLIFTKDKKPLQTRQIYIVTTTANEQPKEEAICPFCDYAYASSTHRQECQNHAAYAPKNIDDKLAQACLDFQKKHDFRRAGLTELDFFKAGFNYRTLAPSLAPVDESVEERAEKHACFTVGSLNALFYDEAFVSAIKARAKRSYIAGATDQLNECLKEHVRLDDVVKVLSNALKQIRRVELLTPESEVMINKLLNL